MSQPPIDSNVPLPMKYPFDKMKVGDSFLVPSDVTRQAVAVAASRYGKAHNMKFSTRQLKDGSFRCWRIE